MSALRIALKAYHRGVAKSRLLDKIRNLENPPMSIITPTIGRKVWYWPFPTERSESGTQPFDATVAFVHPTGTINVAIISELGYAMTPRHHVRLRNTPEEAQPGECSWMPWQAGQARAQAAEKEGSANPN